jgi:hypothetical protein
VKQLREMHTYASEAGDVSAAAAAAVAQQEAEPASPFVGAAPAQGAFLVPKLEPGCSAADPGSPSRSNVSNNNALNGGGGSAVTTGGHTPVVPQGGGVSWCTGGTADLPKPRQPMFVAVTPATSHTRVQCIGALGCPVPCCGLAPHLSPHVHGVVALKQQ